MAATLSCHLPRGRLAAYARMGERIGGLMPTERTDDMRVIVNASGRTAGRFQHGAFIQNDAGASYWATMVGRGWSAELPMPAAFRTQRDINSTATAYSIAVIGGSSSAARLDGTYRQDWAAERGEMNFRELMAKGKVSAKDAASIVAFYGLDI